MSIQSNQLIYRRSIAVSDLASNGGRMSANPSVSDVKNNVFDDVYEADRVAGVTNYRKIFIHNNNPEIESGSIHTGLTLVNARVFVETRTPGQDIVTIYPPSATPQRQIRSGISGSEQKYGMGILATSTSVGATSIVVTVEDWTTRQIFANGMMIRISSKTSILDSGGVEEYRTISGAPSAAGNNVTLTLSSALANAYTAGSGTKISSVYQAGDVKCVVSGFVKTGTGTFTSSYIATDNTGTIEQDWVLTFTSATAYTVVGDTVGSVGSGNVGADFAPTNAELGGKYFRLLSAGFGGTFSTGNTINFTTSPAAIPLWYDKLTPAGSSSLSGNSAIIAVDGESA